MPENHDGPHGLHIGSGIVLAPHGGGEGGFINGWSDSDISCESCGAEMRSKKFVNGGGLLDCTKCGQKWSFGPDGSSSCVSTTLWPSDMKETDTMYRDYVDWKLKQWIFAAHARRAFGLIDEVEQLRLITKATKTVEDWKQAHPPRLRFWTKLFKAVGRQGAAPPT